MKFRNNMTIEDEIWFFEEESINEKLGYIDHLTDLDLSDKLKYLLQKKPDNLHGWIQLLREQKKGVEDDWDNREFKEMLEVKLHEISDKALLLAKFIINNPGQAINLIWIVRDLLGHNPLLFTTIKLDRCEIEFIYKAIQSNHYDNYPYVILVRYIQPIEREQFVKPIIEYANQLDNNMSWAMTGESCETLAFLNCCPEDSMKCLAIHLNDGGCDGFPADSIIKSIHIFKEYGNLIVDELIEYLDELGVDVGDTQFEIKYLSYFVCDKVVAKKILPSVVKALGETNISDLINYEDGFWDDGGFAESRRLILLFYGQLQAIIQGDL